MTMSDNAIEVSSQAVAALSEVLDDALTVARVNYPTDFMDRMDDIATQALTVLGQFGWELHNTLGVADDDEDEEPRTRNLLGPEVFQAIAKGGQTDV